MSEDAILDELGLLQDMVLLQFRAQLAGNRQLVAILKSLAAISTQETTQMATFQDLQQQVTKSDSVMDGAVTLLGNISQMLKDALAAGQNGGDPAATKEALDKVIADLDQRTESLAAAIVQNTPADPNPQPQPQPLPTDEPRVESSDSGVSER